MALQRTRRPRFRSGRSLRSLGSPLNARPFGATRISSVCLLLLIGLLDPPFAHSDNDRGMTRRNMAAYEARHPGVFKVGGDVKPPKIVRRVKPNFERIPARRRTYRGPVIVYAVVTEQGKVFDPVVVSAAQPDLDRVVLSAIRQWRYEPALRNGREVPIFLTVTVTF
jgi:TonB family protein